MKRLSWTTSFGRRLNHGPADRRPHRSAARAFPASGYARLSAGPVCRRGSRHQRDGGRRLRRRARAHRRSGARASPPRGWSRSRSSALRSASFAGRISTKPCRRPWRERAAVRPSRRARPWWKRCGRYEQRCIAVGTAYDEAMNARLRDYLAASGFEVAGLVGMNIRKVHDAMAVTDAAILELAHAASNAGRKGRGGAHLLRRFRHRSPSSGAGGALRAPGGVHHTSNHRRRPQRHRAMNSSAAGTQGPSASPPA